MQEGRSHHPAKASLKRVGACVGFAEPLGMRRPCPFGSGDLRDCGQPKRRGGRRPADRELSSFPRHRGRRREGPRGAAYSEADQSAHPPTRQCPHKPGRAVFGSRAHARGRGIDGPAQGSPRPKVVERSADRRGTVDSSPFHPQEKESPLPPSAPQVLTRLRRTSPQARNKRLGSHVDRRGGMAPDWPAASDRRRRSK